MRSKQILEGSSIVLAVFTVFIVMSTSLSTYSTYLLALLIIFSAIYISIKKRSKSASNLFSGGPIELYGLISIITLMISLTSGLNSPLFFFSYFILFLLAYMCEPITILIYLVSAVLFFIPQASSNPNTDTLIKMGSLILIAPIAYFIGQEFERRRLLNEKIDSKTDEIIQEAQLLKEDGTPKGQDETEAIDEIIEEASSLKKDSEE
jgi:hypothetical protein